MTGRIITVSKDELAYEAGGRRLPIWVEHGTAVIVQGTPGHWDDGADATDADLQAAQQALELEAQQRGWRLDMGTDLVRAARIHRLAADVEAIGPGRVRDRASGAELDLLDGGRVRYRLGGRTADLQIARDTAAMAATLPDGAQWDDGTPLSAAEVAAAGEAAARAGAWWGWWSHPTGEERPR